MQLLCTLAVYFLLHYTTYIIFASAEKQISFQDQNIQYYGRWHTFANEIQSGWPGAYFKFNVENTRNVKLQLNEKSITLLVQIDKGPKRLLKSVSKQVDLTPQGLQNNGLHEISVYSASIDADLMSIQLQSITVDDEGHTVPLPPSSIMPLVEFIGHDLTLGVGTSDSIQTGFAWSTSEMLGLEHSLIAYKNATLIDGLDRKYFDWLQQEQQKTLRTPWGIVILLGANDCQTECSSNEYRDVLNEFLGKIRKTLYDHIPIFILSEPLGDMFRPSQQSVLDMTHRGDQHIYFIDTTAWLRYGSTYYKDIRHLTDAGHAILAKKLAALLQVKLANPRDPLPGPQPNPNLPDNWQTMDVGKESQVGLPGTVSSDSSSTFTLWGSGADIDNDTDAFRFVYQPFSSQGVLESTVRSHSTFAKCAKAGIMIREHLGPGSPLIMLGISPAEGVFVQIRYANFESTKLIKKKGAMPPYRLRLTRKKEEMFEAQVQYVNDFGMNSEWETFTSVPFTLARDVYAGLAVTSCDTSVVSVAKFTEVTLRHTAFTLKNIPPRLIDQYY